MTVHIGRSETGYDPPKGGQILSAIRTYRTLCKKHKRNQKQVAVIMHKLYSPDVIQGVKDFLDPEENPL